jgi:outer membrane protein insertion porin family
VRPTKQARPAKSESPAKGARPTKGESPTKQARPPKGESGISARLRLVLLGLLKVRSGDPFNGGRVAADSARLKAYFKDRGYPFAQVVVRRRSVPSQRRIDVTFQIRKGPRLRIGEIAVRGASATGRWLVERALGSVQVGQYYHHARLAAALQRLQRTGAFERVDFKVLPKSDGTKRVVIRFEVDERPVAAGASNPR